MSGAGSRVGTRLRRRLVIQVTLLTAVVCAAMAWAALWLIADSVARQFERRVAGRQSECRLLLERHAASVDTVLPAVEDHLRRVEPNLLEALLSGPSALAAERLARVAGLDFVEVLDGEGTVLSSTLWPERAGLQDALFATLPEGRPLLWRVRGAHERRLAHVARRTFRVGSREIRLVGGAELDLQFVERVAGSDAAVLVDPAVEDPIVWGMAPAAAHRAGELEAAAPRSEIADADGARWTVARVELQPQAPPPAWVVLAVDRAPADAALLRLRRLLVLVALGATLAAALGGVWTARRVTRPVAELVRAVDAVAAGQADYTFTRRVEDEFEELVSAFSRLHRSLELQQARSRAVERVAAWREVARRVAHEVKNPLAPIRLTAQNLVRAREKQLPDWDSMFHEGMGTIVEEVDRLSRLVGEFSEFARLPLPRPRPVDLHRLIDEVLMLYAAEPGLRIHKAYAADLPPLALDPDQISRALKNVIGNAVESMRASGPGFAGPSELRLRTAVEDALVLIEVDDTGGGFSDEALEQLFQPYFSTKEGGTGLGLSMTYRIVTEHGGVIRARNRPGGGARVTFRLPLGEGVPQ